MGAPKKLIDRLPPETGAASLAPIIAKLKESACQITLEASRVEILDASGLEALLVITATQRDRGDAFALEAPSQAFLSDLSLFGATQAQLKGPAP